MKWESFGCFVGTGCTFLPSRHQELQRRLRKHRRPGVWWAHWQRYWYQLLERTLWLHFSVEWNRSWRKLDITTCIMPFTPLDCQLPRAWWPQSILHWFLDGRFIGTAGWTTPNSYATDATKGRRTLRKAKNVWSSSQTSLPSVFPNFLLRWKTLFATLDLSLFTAFHGTGDARYVHGQNGWIFEAIS